MRKILRYRDLIVTLVLRDLKVRYRRSTIGFVWTMLQPLLMLVVLHFAFAQIFQARFGLRNYTSYALAGILFWNFFQQSVLTSMNSLRGNAHILLKVPVPLAIFPISTVISGIINLLFALVPLFVIVATTDRGLGSAIFFLPVSILLAALFTLGAGLLLSPLAVFFHDVTELVGVTLTLLFYLTPIIYPTSLVDGHSFYWVVRYSPIRSILEVFRDPIYYNKIPHLPHLAVATAITLVTLGIGAAVFRRSVSRVPFYL